MWPCPRRYASHVRERGHCGEPPWTRTGVALFMRRVNGAFVLARRPCSLAFIAVLLARAPLFCSAFALAAGGRRRSSPRRAGFSRRVESCCGRGLP